MPFRLRLLHRLLELASWKNLEQLVHDAAKSFHGAVPPVGSQCWCTTDLIQGFSSVCFPFFLSQSLIWTDVPLEEGSFAENREPRTHARPRVSCHSFSSAWSLPRARATVWKS